jgi:hypothetical protein
VPPDGWTLSVDLALVAARWPTHPARDLVKAG